MNYEICNSFIHSFNNHPDQKKNRVSGKAGKGTHGSSNAYMLVYSKREVEKEENGSLSTTSSKSESLLPEWVQATLHNENEDFDRWNRETVTRKVPLMRNYASKYS